MRENEQVDIGLDDAACPAGPEAGNTESGTASGWGRLPFHIFIGLQFFLLIYTLVWQPDGNPWWLLGAEMMATISVCIVGAYAMADLIYLSEAGSPPAGDAPPRLLLSMMAVLASAISFVVSGNVGESAPILIPIWISAVAGDGFVLGMYYVLSTQFSPKNAVIALLSAICGIIVASSCFQTYRAAAPLNSAYADILAGHPNGSGLSTP